MLNMKVKIDQKFFEQAAGLRKKAAVVIAGIVATEFEELLRDAPQKSGNYVANMAVQAGSAMGRKGGQLYFPPNPTAGQMVQRGSLDAIGLAMSANPNIVSNMTRHIKRQAGWLPAVTIYNRLDYGAEVEAYSAGQLRAPNKPGAHAMQKTVDRLNAWFSRTIPI